MSKLNGKVALVTGGNSGIGLATAKLYSEQGAKVIVTARSQETYEKAKNEIDANIDIFRADISKLDEIQSLIDYVKQKYGQIDVLFANAGIAYFSPLSDINESFFDSQFNVNVKGLFFTVQKANPILADGASIIFNTSASNTKGIAGSSVYAATKAAVRSLARTLSAELIQRGIRVNAVSPGPVETPIYSKMGMEQKQIDEFAKSIQTSTPIGRFGSPEEIASAALFLASNDSSFIVGSEIVADGGFSQL